MKQLRSILFSIVFDEDRSTESNKSEKNDTVNNCKHNSVQLPPNNHPLFPQKQKVTQKICIIKLFENENLLCQLLPDGHLFVGTNFPVDEQRIVIIFHEVIPQEKKMNVVVAAARQGSRAATRARAPPPSNPFFYEIVSFSFHHRFPFSMN